MMKISKDGKCRFDPGTHSYYIGNRRLLGVTTFIGKYKNKFDAPAVAAAYVAKNGGDVVELLAKWKAEGEASCVAGTAVHDVLERYVLHGMAITGGAHAKEAIAIKFIADFFKTGRLIPVEPEVLVYNEEAGLASMIDLIAKDKEGRHYIIDYKTNKKIDSNGWGKIMAAPFNAMPDANYYHYQLQVNIYKQLYKEHPIAGMYVVHFGENNYELINMPDINLNLEAVCKYGHPIGNGKIG